MLAWNSHLLFLTAEPPPPSLPIWSQIQYTSHPPSLSPSSSITFFPPIPPLHTSFSPHPHGDALQADNGCNLPSAAVHLHRYLSLQHLQITHNSLSASSLHPSFPSPWFPFPLSCLFQPQQNEGLMKMNDASQLPYPSPICFFCSCGVEFPRNSSIPLSVLSTENSKDIRQPW